MALVRVDKSIVIQAAQEMIATIIQYQKCIDDVYVTEYQKPQIWNLWKGTKDLPDRLKDKFHYPTRIYDTQLYLIGRILRAAEIATDALYLSDSDIENLGL